MAPPLPAFAANLTAAAASLTAAAADATVLAAAPAPAALGGPPQWALDSDHDSRWRQYRHAISTLNYSLTAEQNAGWLSARSLNATATIGQISLFPLSLPRPLIPLPVIPPTPAPGAPLNHPPAGLPAPAPVLGAHTNFPATRANLDTLSGAQLNGLLTAYNIPGFVPGLSIAQRRVLFANFIGVRL